MTILTKDRDNANLDIAAENRGGIEYPLNHILNAAGTKIDPATEVTLAAVNAKLPALSGGSVPVTGPLTDTQLRATALPVSGTFWQATQPVSLASWAGLTDAQLRATAVPVSGTFWQATQPVSLASWAGLTDTQLRASNINTTLAALTYPASANNSSTVQLAAGASFTGTIETIQNQQSAQIQVVCDQPYSVTINQYIDAAGLQRTSSDTLTRAAGVPLAVNAMLPGNFFNLVVTNNGASTTTTLAVDTTFGIMDTLPRTLGQKAAADSMSVVLASDQTVAVSPVSPTFWRVGFAEVGSGLQGLAATRLSLLQTGAGMSVSQAGGNLLITTGTTANAETVIRSQTTVSGSLFFRYKAILSQRIVNQTFRFELADLVGESLAYTINSATSVTVTFPTANPFTAANVGQSLRLSLITGAAGIPGRYAIASVSGLTVTFTVAAWPASGSGTLTLYGFNWLANEYSGTNAANSSFDAQRRGWNSGATTATMNTSASPGHVGQIAYDVHTAGLSDALVASNTGYQWTQRASRVENMPDVDVPLYLFIVVQNGSTAPASTTTLTIGFVQIEDQGRQKVRIASADPVGSHAAPVQAMGGTIGTVTTVSTVSNLAAIAAGANAIGDVGIQYRANNTGAATLTNINCPATPAAQQLKTGAGRLVGLYLFNTSASVRWVKIFNLAGASVTPGTTAATTEIGIPAGGRLEFGSEGGAAFATGITVMITGAAGLTNNTVVTLGDVTGFSLHA